MRYALAYLNHNGGVWKYNLECIDIPVFDKSYFDVGDYYFPILCKIIKPGVLQDIITGEIIHSTIHKYSFYTQPLFPTTLYKKVGNKSMSFL